MTTLQQLEELPPDAEGEGVSSMSSTPSSSLHKPSLSMSDSSSLPSSVHAPGDTTVAQQQQPSDDVAMTDATKA